MAQAVENLPQKLEALNSNPSTGKKKKKATSGTVRKISISLISKGSHNLLNEKMQNARQCIQCGTIFSNV
jgi:hypothetical protein